jgi:hypothetical protein
MFDKEYYICNRLSEMIHTRFKLKQKNNEYDDFIKKIVNTNPFELNNNLPPVGVSFGLSYIRATEIYSRNDIPRVRKMFRHMAKISSPDEIFPYLRAENQYKKIVDDILFGKFDSSLQTMIGFNIRLKDRLIESFSPSLEIIGPGLYKLEFSFRIRDSVKFEYWNAAVHQFNTSLKIVPVVSFTGIKFQFKVEGGGASKRRHLGKIQDDLSLHIRKIIRKHARGIFESIYGFIPTLFVFRYDEETYYQAFGNYEPFQASPVSEPTEFFKVIEHSDCSETDIYVQDAVGNVFVETSKLKYPKPRIRHKFFEKIGTYPPLHDIFWLGIIQSILLIQNNLADDIMNSHISSTVNRYGSDVNRKRRKLNEIDAVHNLLMSVFDRQKRFFEHYSEAQSTFKNKITDNVIHEYFRYKLDSVEYLRKELEGQLPRLKEIYQDWRDDLSEKNAVRLQWVGIVLAVVTLFQAYTQCTLSRDSVSDKQKTVTSSTEILNLNEKKNVDANIALG